MLADAVARIFLFSLIFISTHFISRALEPYANPWVMIGMLIIVPVASTMYLYPSDVLFAGLAGVAFGQMLLFYTHRKRKHLYWASGWMGLAVLARAEGLLLIGVLLIVTLVISIPSKKWTQNVFAVLLPFILLVGGYILVFGMATGDYGTGLPERTFNNFESGHEIIYSQSDIYSPTVSARIESNQIFGTGEENDYSVFKAIRRNPAVYLHRLKQVVPNAINFAVKAYGNKFILIFVWLSVRGLIALIKRKHIAIALLSIFWFVPLGAGVINTFFREGYFMMPYFVVFTLSSIGISEIIKNWDKTSEKIGLLASSLVVIVISIFARNMSMLFRGSIFIIGLGLLEILRRFDGQESSWRINALWVLFCAALFMRGGYVSPQIPSYGNSDIEKSVYSLQDVLPVESKVLAGAPANIWAARMTYYGINSFDIPQFETAEEFYDWLTNQGVDAIYIDQHFPEYYQNLVASISDERLKEVYTNPERELIIYLLK